VNRLWPASGAEIVEAGLLLRPWRADDADAVYQACQDPLIQRWTRVPRPYRPEHARGFVTTFTENSWKSGSAAPLGVFDRATGEMLGSTGLVAVEENLAEAEIGYWSAPWARGRGATTAAARAVARWALHHLNLNRLIWRAEVGNHASRLIAERIGVRVEGLLRQSITRPGSGVPVDAWTGSLLPGELREADGPNDPTDRLRVATFSAAQPRVIVATDPGVSLRPPRWQDIPAMVTACQDPESLRWTTLPDPYGRSDAEFFVNEQTPGRWLRGEGAIFSVADADDTFAGSMELRLARTGIGEVGYLMAPWVRGRGYASAALRALCDWAFDAFGLGRIEWFAYVGNDASRRVAEKAGFTMEGLRRSGSRQRGQLRDSWTGAKLSTDPR
jgi:RimJ/RimL family protein N-acetyltransferase